MTATLYVAVTGAPLARRTADAIPEARARGWVPAVIATAAAQQWLDLDALAGLDVPVITEQRTPGTAKRLPPADAVAIVPATFNTVNKLATGIADTYPMSVLCEALGNGVPITVVPFLKASLANHPAWSASLTVLQHAGVALIDPRDGERGTHVPLTSGTGDAVAEGFKWAWVLDHLPALAPD